jgi:hypothetical protein
VPDRFLAAIQQRILELENGVGQDQHAVHPDEMDLDSNDQDPDSGEREGPGHGLTEFIEQVYNAANAAEAEREAAEAAEQPDLPTFEDETVFSNMNTTQFLNSPPPMHPNMNPGNSSPWSPHILQGSPNGANGSVHTTSHHSRSQHSPPLSGFSDAEPPKASTPGPATSEIAEGQGMGENTEYSLFEKEPSPSLLSRRSSKGSSKGSPKKSPKGGIQKKANSPSPRRRTPSPPSSVDPLAQFETSSMLSHPPDEGATMADSYIN